MTTLLSCDMRRPAPIPKEDERDGEGCSVQGHVDRSHQHERSDGHCCEADPDYGPRPESPPSAR
jgi:hypothetical protein